jgi:hypothetical protein
MPVLDEIVTQEQMEEKRIGLSREERTVLGESRAAEHIE